MDRRGFVQGGLATVAVLAAVPVLAQEKAPGKRNLLLASGVPYGTFNAVGQAICNLTNTQGGETFACKPRGTAGSVANVNSLGRRIDELGIAQADVVWFAANGTREWDGKPVQTLRIVLPLYFEAITLVTRADAKIESVADLKGKTVSIGNAGSGARVNALDVLSWYGLEPGRDFVAQNLDLTHAVTKMAAREIDAFFFTVGHPTEAITKLAESTLISLVSIDGPPVEAALQRQPYYVSGNLPSRLYRGVIAPVRTVGVRALLVTHDGLPPDTIYAFTKALVEQWDGLRAAHRAVQPFRPEDIGRQTAAPYHPGAIRYLRERGFL